MACDAVLWLLLPLLPLAASQHPSWQEIYATHPELFRTTPEMIAADGYPVETHTLQTKDGYLLTLHRIPYGRSYKNQTRPPVLLIHGLFCMSDMWVLNGPESSLGYMLADAGYDVWLGNVRGNKYSRAHVSIPTTDKRFWKFSWHEMGIYDIPAKIDYILQATGYKQLFYVGHSMGTTVFHVMCSMRPEYNRKVRLASLLAPAVFLKGIRTPLGSMAIQFRPVIERFLETTGYNEILPPSKNRIVGTYLLCRDQSNSQDICNSLFQLSYGVDNEGTNKTLLPLYAAHFLGSTSKDTLLHFAQSIQTGGFAMYDFGSANNAAIYRSEKPPRYDIKRINVPVIVYYGDNDYLVNPKVLGSQAKRAIDVSQLPMAVHALLRSLLAPLLVGASQHLSWQDLNATHPEFFMTAPEMIASNGYPVETHTVKTDDGYLLTLHRIPFGKNFRNKTGPPILLTNALFAMSDMWMLQGTRSSLSYMLADAGYDIWLGNMRGTKYSRRHVSIPTTDKQFWRFSWHEMGIYDVPAMIDYILQVTRYKKLFYAGLSMGTTVFHVMCTIRPEYNKRIRLAFLLSPTAILKDNRSPFRNLIFQFKPILERFFQITGYNEVLPPSKNRIVATYLLCRDESTTQNICASLIQLGAGIDYEGINKTLIPFYTSHYFGSTSKDTLLHYLQLMRRGDFRLFDFGPTNNMVKYGSEKPPKYDNTLITAPVVAYYGENDYIVNPKAVLEVSRQYQHLVDLIRVPEPKFNHIDFIIHKNIKYLLYDNIISLIKLH